MMVFFKERSCYDNLQLLVKKFTVQRLNASHKQGIPQLNKNHAYMIRGPTKCNQQIV